MIRISHVCIRYAGTEFRLEIPELVLPRGEQVAIVGPSGSGKSTLLLTLAGVLLPERGEIEVAGTQVNQLSDAARRRFRTQHVGFVFQDFELLEYLSVEENLLLPYRINRGLRLTKSVRERARALAQSTGIADKLRRKPGQLSHGERQRVAICRALLTEPEVILADEPTGSLDPRCANEVLQLLLKQARQSTATLVCVTHDHSLLKYFDRVIQLDQFHDAASMSAPIRSHTSEVS